ncbi:hypothetical protein [Desulfitobacterium dehalogenans]|uniref:hypothetical protein n=1 Tax=Desulfitobacterium dehalogenans TaxID=36854 RepID=UPI0005A539F1|nr:hypothetical protein [Desulfitobacterium dehalogenans]
MIYPICQQTPSDEFDLHPASPLAEFTGRGAGEIMPQNDAGGMTKLELFRSSKQSVGLNASATRQGME